MQKRGILGICLIVFIIVICVLFFSVNKHNDAEVILSDKTIPSVQLVHDAPYTIKKSVNQEEYKKNWDYFRLKKAKPKIDFKKKTLYFLGLYESGSCPIHLEKMNVNSEQKELTLSLKNDNGVCTDDASPRTFVIKVDKKISKNVNKAIIEEHANQSLITIE